MLNIDKFVQIRKFLKLSQTELCSGICTQSTLSKFENNGLVPSFKILNQLCERMNISLSDLMGPSEEAGVTEQLIEADFSLVSYDYEKLARLMAKVKQSSLKKSDDKFHYQYLKGQVALYDKNEPMSALYYFNGILTAADLKANSIYRLLALNGCSEVYFSQKEFDKAKHYYDQIKNEILKFKVNSNEEAIQVLSILCTAGEFYGEQGDYKHSNKLLNAAYNLCATRHLVFFLARTCLRLGENIVAQNGDIQKAKDNFYDAIAFGRLNDNQQVIERAQSALESL